MYKEYNLYRCIIGYMSFWCIFQPVFNHYKCITYVCSYLLKDETECSQAIINAAREA